MSDRWYDIVARLIGHECVPPGDRVGRFSFDELRLIGRNSRLGIAPPPVSYIEMLVACTLAEHEEHAEKDPTRAADVERLLAE